MLNYSWPCSRRNPHWQNPLTNVRLMGPCLSCQFIKFPTIWKALSKTTKKSTESSRRRGVNRSKSSLRLNSTRRTLWAQWTSKNPPKSGYKRAYPCLNSLEPSRSNTQQHTYPARNSPSHHKSSTSPQWTWQQNKNITKKHWVFTMPTTYWTKHWTS